MKQRSDSAGRRLGVITVDQAVSGASNIVASLLAARLLGISAFGLFGIVFLVYVLVLGCFRALVGEPLLLRPSDARRRAGEALGTALLLGGGFGVVVLLTGVVAELLGARTGPGLITLGACLPLLAMQDLGRYLGFATRRPGQALVLDLLWLVLLVAAAVGLMATGTRTLSAFIVAWAGAGALAGLLVFGFHRGTALRPSRAWLAETWGVSWRYLTSYASTQGSTLAASVALGAIAGARALGAVQGALLLVRPFVTLQNAAIAAGVSEVSHDEHRVAATVRRTTALTTAAALANGAVLVVLPGSVGNALLGATWQGAGHLVLPAAVQVLMMGLISGVRAGLLGVRAVSTVTRIDVGGTVAVLALMVGGTVVGGATGALWGVALGHTIMVPVWWRRRERLRWSTCFDTGGTCCAAAATACSAGRTGQSCAGSSGRGG